MNEVVAGGGGGAFEKGFEAEQGPRALPPDVAAQVAAAVEADAEDPGPQVVDAADLFPMAPALEERFLHGVLSVVGAAQQQGQGVQQVGARLGESVQQGLAAHAPPSIRRQGRAPHVRTPGEKEGIPVSDDPPGRR